MFGAALGPITVPRAPSLSARSRDQGQTRGRDAPSIPGRGGGLVWLRCGQRSCDGQAAVRRAGDGSYVVDE